ncbi:MAG TPA: hypothetical protein VI386_19250 [Candidatus Sulfotelmatobacter sp.]
MEAEILPPQTADQTGTTLSREILRENHRHIDACALVLRNQYPAQSFPNRRTLKRGTPNVSDGTCDGGASGLSLYRLRRVRE